MLDRTLRLAETVAVLGLLCGSAALLHLAGRRGSRRLRAELVAPLPY